jgi:CheY-like chemotaxis protein
MAKIVFCEDDDLMRKLIGIVLRGTPHEIYFASDGLAGLALIERERPALVFTDHDMLGLNGFELCAALKAKPYLAHIPVILMSGAVLDEAQIAQGSFTTSLAKPFRPGALRAKIDQFLVSQPMPNN